GGRRGSAAVSPAGMPTATAASSPQVREARARLIRASHSSLSSRPCTNAALSRSITRSRSASEARGPAADWAPGSGLTSASHLYSQRNPVSVRRPSSGAAALPLKTMPDRLATPTPLRAGTGPFISWLDPPRPGRARQKTRYDGEFTQDHLNYLALPGSSNLDL